MLLERRNWQFNPSNKKMSLHLTQQLRQSHLLIHGVVPTFELSMLNSKAGRTLRRDRSYP